MRRLRVKQKANDLDTLDLSIEEVPSPPLTGSQVRVRVHAAGVNQSDVKATLGSMPKAVWPRTPGRDWAGVVEEGPAEWKGAEVFGTGGDLGITRDGSHATELVLPADALTRRPSQLAMAEAGSLGVPFVTAWEGLYRAGMPAPGEVVLVLAVNGKVGQAAAQIAAMRGARVFGVTRGKESFAGNARVPVRMIDSTAEDAAQVVKDETNGHGADIAFNTIGSPYFAAANAALAIRGRQALISTIERTVTFDIFQFYRGQHSFYGVDSLALDAAACARILSQLAPGFDAGALHPYRDIKTYKLEQAKEAYRDALGSEGQAVLTP